MSATKVSVISTVLNEEISIGELLEALSAQTFTPEEIVIVDAGSRDKTVALMEKYAHSLPLKVFVCPGANRAEGRNIAIREASGDIIVSIDGGCIPYPNWLENLVSPLIEESSLDVVGGYYEPVVNTPLQEAIAALTVPSPKDISPSEFLPSSRSVAFRKQVWERVGGYPEWMRSAEDTVFDILLKKAGAKFLFQPEAKVKWRMRESLRGVFRQFYEYSFWDARAGVFFPHYHKIWLYLGGLILLILSCFFPAVFYALSIGFLIYISRFYFRAKRRRLSPKAYLWLLPALFTYDLGNVSGYILGKLTSLKQKIKSEGGEISC